MYSNNGQQGINEVTFGILYVLRESEDGLNFSFIDEVASRLDMQGYRSTKDTILSGMENINDLLLFKKLKDKSLEEIVHFIELEIQNECHYNKLFNEFIRNSRLMVIQNV